ncbi:zinc ribbon domain-containing protein [Micromonospora cathayae]|uniref:Zinc ribbon domain-containing protein n=1 Tax=Micromonospora cathayae TaxID=3028804 RepID=A0ABY7ZUY4_9ACTN|nr:zinc ribbon domain-containing protein [Micromonospora sp. HUAS 3]WDZ86822.1 zinc ribbon domain-containing protein [Micromonospora sp. HUAS 3]
MRRVPVNHPHWTLLGLVRCGYCGRTLLPEQAPGGPRAYACGPRCGRTWVDALTLEAMAVRTALAAIPALAIPTDRREAAALVAEMFRLVVVHDDQTDVVFVGYAN